TAAFRFTHLSSLIIQQLGGNPFHGLPPGSNGKFRRTSLARSRGVRLTIYANFRLSNIPLLRCQDPRRSSLSSETIFSATVRPRFPGLWNRRFTTLTTGTTRQHAPVSAGKEITIPISVSAVSTGNY